MKYYYEGGPLFMGILTLILFILILFVISNATMIYNRKEHNKIRQRLSYLKSTGLLGLVFGIFGQLIGLYQAFEAIQELGEVSPALVAGGLRVSMLTTLYGFIIFLLAYILWFALVTISNYYNKQE